MRQRNFAGIDSAKFEQTSGIIERNDTMPFAT